MTIYYIYCIKDKPTNNRDYFFTRVRKEQAIYNLKKSKKDSNIKSILEANNYTIKFLQTLDTNIRDEVRSIIDEWKDHHAEQDEFNKFKILHVNTRNKSLEYGLLNELTILLNLNKFKTFGTTLTKSKYTKSLFDYYGKNYLFEVKSLTYSFDKYLTSIMNRQKITNTNYPNFIFIFEYTELNNTKKMFYHIYDSNFEYNVRNITPKNRLNVCEVIDIQKHKLIEFKFTDSIILPNITDKNIIKQFKLILEADKLLSIMN